MKKKLETAYGVIGLGRFGEALAMMLAQSGNEVIVVDRDEKKVKEMRQYTDCAFVTDDLSKETLKEIGIQNCDVVIICIGEKVDVSVLTTMSVIEMGVPRVIAKALSPAQGAVLGKLGGGNPSDTGSGSFGRKEYRRDGNPSEISFEYYCD